MKEKIAITLDEKILKRIDSMVDGTNVKSRSHAIELLLRKSLTGEGPRKAVILAGGKGTRLRPITYEIPKALIPVHDRTLTEHLFDLFKRHGINDIVLSIGHLGDKIKKEYGDGSRYNVNINYVEEKEPLGTGGPLRLARNMLKGTFVVTNGDELKDIDLTAMYEFHKKSGALVTIALTTVSDPSQYGVARLEGNKILEFVEKPKREEAPSKLINSGLYMMEPEVIEMVKESGFCMLEKDVFPRLASMGKLYGFPFSGQWFDTGNMERYEKALKNWKDLN
ncbi:MAG: nucleotidyltransferase family protein [Candidatus Aenigmatarchaeota archaeon]|nr:MAG: nucleotidyltransferase family protein [Candidatus Aenigmarchaeota archaeon]